jgi:hypothetical protein
MFGFGGGNENNEAAAAGGGGAAAGGDPAAAGAAPAEEKKVGSMPSGDYSVHFHIQTGKNFVMPDEETVDPYVQIELIDQSKCSTTKNDITVDAKVNFNEHIFIDLKKVDNEVVEEANIVITVLNKGFFKGDIIG